jgi:hypothetical protein
LGQLIEETTANDTIIELTAVILQDGVEVDLEGALVYTWYINDAIWEGKSGKTFNTTFGEIKNQNIHFVAKSTPQPNIE